MQRRQTKSLGRGLIRQISAFPAWSNIFPLVTPIHSVFWRLSKSNFDVYSASLFGSTCIFLHGLCGSIPTDVNRNLFTLKGNQQQIQWFDKTTEVQLDKGLSLLELLTGECVGDYFQENGALPSPTSDVISDDSWQLKPWHHDSTAAPDVRTPPFLGSVYCLYNLVEKSFYESVTFRDFLGLVRLSLSKSLRAFFKTP